MSLKNSELKLINNFLKGEIYMQKTMKKLLSIILTILMIVTTVPVAFAAEGDAPLTIDVTDKNVVGIGKGAIFYDEDGYIITGTNENCDINVYESSNITLRNLSAKSMGINSTDGVFVTINLEGINELAEDLSFYKEHIIFEGSDDAIFKADYIYNGGNGEASVTLNGGNIVFESVSRENFTVCCGKLIINGGTLTASNDSDYVIGSSVELNGGELNIISTSQQYPAILKKITMKKGALLTLSAKTRMLDNSAEITVADGAAENDCFFVRYDTVSDFVPVHNICSALDGKTYAEIKIDTHEHSFEATGKCVCGYECDHAGQTGTCTICGKVLHTCDFSGEWKYDSEKHWKECTCGEIDGEAEHTFTDGKCDCGYECVHANYADGACDNCDVKQKYTVRMETKLSEGVEFVGNPVAIHGEDLIIEFKNLVSEKCNDVSLFKLTIGANSFYEFEFDENGITFDGTVLTIPGELVNGDVETHANAYTQARIKLNGGKFSPECPPDIVEEYFIENDYAISNKMLVGYTNSVKDTFVKDKHTIKSILASDGNDYNKIYYFSPNSDLEMTIEWECLPENFENGVCVECGYECSHEKYTDGVCDVCGYKCPHEWVGVAFAKPTRTEEGYYTYTCSVCKSTKTEPVERPANYAEFKELIEKVKGYLDENLTDSMMQEVNNVINFFELDENHGFIKGEENTVSQMIRQISGFVEVVEEGIADGTAVKVDGFTVYNERGREWLLKFADEGIFEKARELILNSTEVKAKMDEIYDFALSLEGNVAENAENIAKIEADVDEFFGQLKKCVYGIHNVSQYKEISPAKCGENAVESATCTLCGETVTREVENSALKHSFTKYEVTEEAKCGVEGKEVAYCDNGCGETDEKAIEALTHTDADGDYICDNGCGYEFEKPAPEEPTPDTPDEPTDDACDHLCHKSGILGFFWKIVKFLSKLFKINPVCECGVAHY